jgi:uncharacterized protein YdhG (YjbR/CyaY superfamily)
MKQFKSVDEYIASYPAEVQAKLKAIRQTVIEAAPGASEKISYGMPYYSLNGRLIYFAAFKNHIGFYPMAAVIKAFKSDLGDYETSKGTIRFPLDKPLPLPLIHRIVEYRVKENQSKKK